MVVLGKLYPQCRGVWSNTYNLYLLTANVHFWTWPSTRLFIQSLSFWEKDSGWINYMIYVFKTKSYIWGINFLVDYLLTPYILVYSTNYFYLFNSNFFEHCVLCPQYKGLKDTQDWALALQGSDWYPDTEQAGVGDWIHHLGSTGPKWLNSSRMKMVGIACVCFAFSFVLEKKVFKLNRIASHSGKKKKKRQS